MPVESAALFTSYRVTLNGVASAAPCNTFAVYSDESDVVALSGFSSCFVIGGPSAVLFASLHSQGCTRGECIAATDTDSLHSLLLVFLFGVNHSHVVRQGRRAIISDMHIISFVLWAVYLPFLRTFNPLRFALHFSPPGFGRLQVGQSSLQALHFMVFPVFPVEIVVVVSVVVTHSRHCVLLSDTRMH